jgi:hypothetical protein
MSDETNACSVRVVTAPDGTQIPVPAGGVGLPDGSMAIIRNDADVQISPKSDNGYYVVLNNADPSNEEASSLFAEFTTEGAIKTLENLATEAFEAVSEIAFEAAGLVAGVLVSLFTSSKLTNEIFIRSALPDGTRVTYCLLV